jgi:2'-5' RNA ligase
MGFAVELYFDEESTRAVLSRCEAIQSSILELGALPHISLSLHDEVDLGLMERLIEEFAARQSVITIELHSLASFMTDECVLFLAPTATPELLALHDQFHRILTENSIVSNEYYLPGKWMPHCTLDFELSREVLAEKFSICHEMGGISQVRLESMGLIEFRPVHELLRFQLQGTER